MAIAKLGEVIGAEVTSMASGGGVNLLLDTDERALLPLRQVFGESAEEQRQRVASMREQTEIRVIVIEDRTSFGRSPFFIVSENVDEHRNGHSDAGRPAGGSVDREELARRFPVGMSVRGKPRRISGGFNVLVDGVNAFLPDSRLGKTKPDSLKPNIAVKAKVAEVNERGQVILTRT